MTEKEIHIEQLMMEKLTGVIGEKDGHYLEDLLQGDKEIQEQWEKIKETFERSGPHHYLQNIDAEGAWMQVREGIAEKRRSRKTRLRKLAIAASLMVPLFLAGLFFYHTRKAASVALVPKSNNGVKLYINGFHAINLSQYKASAKFPALNNINLQVRKGSMSYVPLNNEISHALNTLVVPATATYKITLSDGTEVSLNSMSQLKFAFTFSGNKREVWLKGEAYFKVAKDSRRPFIVHTPLTEIKVLGTEFNVNTYDSLQVKTALVEGSVSTQAADGKNIILKPGYEAVFSSGKGFDVTTFDRNNALSWMRGIYYFQNASLEDIAAVVHRWYGNTILFDDKKSSSSRFTGAMLKEKPLKEFLDNLSFTSNIRYYFKEGVIHITVR